MDTSAQEQSKAPELKPDRRDSDRRDSDRRIYPRFEWSTAVKLGTPGGGPTAQARLSDISLGGCYLDMLAPSPIGTRLYVTFGVEKGHFEAIADVKFSVPRMGMGLQFVSISEQSRALLEKLSRGLSGDTLGTLGGPTYERIVQGLVQLTNALLELLEQKGITSKAELEEIILTRKRQRSAPRDPAQPK